jgi:hypothetical protein
MVQGQSGQKVRDTLSQQKKARHSGAHLLSSQLWWELKIGELQCRLTWAKMETIYNQRKKEWKHGSSYSILA